MLKDWKREDRNLPDEDEYELPRAFNIKQLSYTVARMLYASWLLAVLGEVSASPDPPPQRTETLEPPLPHTESVECRRSVPASKHAGVTKWSAAVLAVDRQPPPLGRRAGSGAT